MGENEGDTGFSGLAEQLFKDVKFYVSGEIDNEVSTKDKIMQTMVFKS